MARKKKCKVFVSYSRHDEALVRPLAGLLGVAADDAVFLDVTSLKPGELWEKEIFEALKQASVFVLCWCCESEKSKNVAKEIAAALSEGNKRLVPVLFCGAPLPSDLKARQWTDLRGKIVHECPVPHAAETKVFKGILEEATGFISRGEYTHAGTTLKQEQPYRTSSADELVVPAAPARSSVLSKAMQLASLAFLAATVLVIVSNHRLSLRAPAPSQDEKSMPENNPVKPSGHGPLNPVHAPDMPPHEPVEETHGGHKIHVTPEPGPAPSAPQAIPAPTSEAPSEGSILWHRSYAELLIAVLIFVGVIALLVLLLKRIVRHARRRKEVHPDEIAAKAKSYFEGLAEK